MSLALGSRAGLGDSAGCYLRLAALLFRCVGGVARFPPALSSGEEAACRCVESSARLWCCLALEQARLGALTPSIVQGSGAQRTADCTPLLLASRQSSGPTRGTLPLPPVDREIGTPSSPRCSEYIACLRPQAVTVLQPGVAWVRGDERPCPWAAPPQCYTGIERQAYWAGI